VLGNLRLIAEYLAKDESLKVFLFYEGELPADTAKHFQIVGIEWLREFNIRTLAAILSSSLIVVDHSIRDVYLCHRSAKRTIVNTWHGVPIKRIEKTMHNIERQRLAIIDDCNSVYDLVTASNDVDRLAMALSFGKRLDEVLSLGLPRYDLLSKDFQLPDDLAEQESRIMLLKQGKRLALYAPTFRENSISPLVQSYGELVNVSDFFASRGWMLGVRLHPYDIAGVSRTRSGPFIPLLAQDFPETNVVLRNSDLLITDFSSIWVDYLLLDRPIVGFARDLSVYQSEQRDFIYDFHEAFPGKFCTSGQELIQELDDILSAPNAGISYDYQKKLFLPRDVRNVTTRVCEEILRHAHMGRDTV
jgi:CDP-glycerol glycerophosphotransferase (TagB/SpsB family)